MENLPRQSIKLDFNRLTRIDVAALQFTHFGREFHFARINYLRNRAPRLGLVAYVVIGKRRATEEEPSGGVHVLLDCDQTVHGRSHAHLLDVLLRLVQGELRLIPLLLRKVDACLAGSGMRFYILFELSQGPRCLFQR